ncbi:MAG TPA: SAM-dependent methyltransferase [Chthoniobacterales bacterium]|jgi:SAM-dependent MidA family methyltransferase
MPPTEELSRFFRAQIIRNGPVTFRWMMQQALYHPEWGYYSSGRATIGRLGDFYTSVSVGRTFGELLTSQFHEMWLRFDKPDEFTIVEQAADRGQLAGDILETAGVRFPDFFEALRYWIIEPSPVLEQEQKKRLARFGKHRTGWVEDIEALGEGSIFGVYFCNELLDAMPVHLVTMSKGQWMENYVDWESGGFQWVLQPPSTQILANHLQKLPTALPNNYRTEVNLKAMTWMEDAARALRCGYITVIDYGFPRAQFYSPDRTQGTLSCYRKHERHYNPFDFIGESDITAHIDFTSIAQVAVESGLEIAGFADQNRFLIGAGQSEFQAIEAESAAGQLSEATSKKLKELQMLTHPESMGSQFKYLTLQKFIEPAPPLMGYQFSPDPYLALGVRRPAKNDGY